MYTINILRNYFYFPIFFQKNLRLGSRGFILLIFIFYSYEIIIDIKLHVKVFKAILTSAGWLLASSAHR
jgi:hypothetical protein